MTQVKNLILWKCTSLHTDHLLSSKKDLANILFKLCKENDFLVIKAIGYFDFTDGTPENYMDYLQDLNENQIQLVKSYGVDYTKDFSISMDMDL